MYCGAPLVEQKVVACPKCMRNNPPTVAACQYCGTNLGGAAASGAKPMQVAELKDANEVRIEAAIKACMVDRDYNRAISLFDDILDEVDAGLRARHDNLKLQSQRQRIMAFMPMIEKMKGQTPASQTPPKQVRHVMVLDPNEKDPVAAIKAKIDEIRAAHVQPPAASMPVEEIKRAVFALAAKKGLAFQSVVPPPRPGGALAESSPAFKQIFIKMQEQALEALKRNQKEEALGILDGSIRYNPGLPGAYMAKAQLLKQLGRNQEAVAALDQGLQIAPREPDL
jgi:tetratricopeptide (TPR) repeat protein